MVHPRGTLVKPSKHFAVLPIVAAPLQMNSNETGLGHLRYSEQVSADFEIALAASAGPMISSPLLRGRRSAAWGLSALVVTVGQRQDRLSPVIQRHHRRRAGVRRVWTALLWQVFFEVPRGWSVRPCVRPVDAVNRTAGHNAFREDGSRPKTRARSASAKVGSPVFRYRPAVALLHVRPFQTF
jgi:hypothetical protein